jgi:predicted dehydrogenase
MSKPVYRVMVVGMGKRGKHHAAAFHADPRFEIVGLCDIDEGRCAEAAAGLGGPAVGTDAAKLAAEVAPDVFCFCTLPNLRWPLVEIGVASGAKLLAFEKPIALSHTEAKRIVEHCAGAGVKAVISHQHRYGEHYRAVAQIIASGELGRVHTLYATGTGWLMHLLTHFVDYLLWFNDYGAAQWVMANAAGRGKLTDIHVSPDYLGGFIQFANGVRGIVEVGAGAPDVPEVDYWWRKCRLGAHGTDGYAEVLTGGGWRAVTKDGVQGGPGCMNYDLDMPPYVADMARWLDGEAVHPCCLARAWQGFEITCGLLRSVVQRGQVALPLPAGPPELEALAEVLPDPVYLSMAGNAKEYPGGVWLGG